MSDELEQLLEKVQDEDVRNGLNDLFSRWTGSRLRSERDRARQQAEEAEANVRRLAYRAAGVSEKSHTILDAMYEDGDEALVSAVSSGNPEDIDAIRDYAKSIGLKVDGAGNSRKEPEPGDPDYVWSSPMERRLWEERNSDE